MSDANQSDFAQTPPSQPNAYGPSVLTTSPVQGPGGKEKSFQSPDATSARFNAMLDDVGNVAVGMSHADNERAAEAASGVRRQQFRSPPSDLRGG